MRTDRYDETNNRFSKSCERAYKHITPKDAKDSGSEDGTDSEFRNVGN